MMKSRKVVSSTSCFLRRSFAAARDGQLRTIKRLINAFVLCLLKAFFGFRSSKVRPVLRRLLFLRGARPGLADFGEGEDIGGHGGQKPRKRRSMAFLIASCWSSADATDKPIDALGMAAIRSV
jgi:hypothetical protein